MKLYFVNTVLATEPDGTIVCHDQSKLEEVHITTFTPQLIAEKIVKHFDGRGSIHVSTDMINDWMGELEYLAYGNLTVGVIPFDVAYYNSVDHSEIDISRDGVYVDLIFAGETGTEELAAEEIRAKPQEHIYISCQHFGTNTATSWHY